jgi:hypothetical protein
MLSLSRLLLRRPLLVVVPRCSFSVAAGGNGQEDKGSAGSAEQQPTAGRSIWAAAPAIPSAGAAARQKKPAVPAREAADATSASSGSAATVPRRAGSWRPGQQQQQQPRPSAAGSWRPGAAAAAASHSPSHSPRVASAGVSGGGGWKPMGDGGGEGAAAAMDFGGELDVIAGGDGGRRRSGFAGKRKGGSGDSGGASQWKRTGQEGGGGGKFSKGRGGARGGGAAGWGSAKERVDSVTGRENYFSALISAKRTTKVTKGGKTRTAQVTDCFRPFPPSLFTARITPNRRCLTCLLAPAGCCCARRLRRQRGRRCGKERREEQGQAEVRRPLFLRGCIHTMHPAASLASPCWPSAPVRVSRRTAGA